LFHGYIFKTLHGNAANKMLNFEIPGLDMVCYHVMFK